MGKKKGQTYEPFTSPWEEEKKELLWEGERVAI